MNYRLEHSSCSSLSLLRRSRRARSRAGTDTAARPVARPADQRCLEPMIHRVDASFPSSAVMSLQALEDFYAVVHAEMVRVLTRDGLPAAAPTYWVVRCDPSGTVCERLLNGH